MASGRRHRKTARPDFGSASRVVGYLPSPALLFKMDNDSRRAGHTLRSSMR